MTDTPLPTPGGQLPPLGIRFDIVPVGGTGFVRFSFDHGIMSTTVCVDVDNVLKFGGDIKRMCHDAEGAWKTQKNSLLIPQKTLIVPGQN